MTQYWLLTFFYATASLWGAPTEVMTPQSSILLQHPAPTQTPSFIPEEFNAPLNESPDRFVSEFLNMLAMLGLILLILLTVTWFLKKVLNAKIQQNNSTSGIRILERRPLTPKSTLFLVEIGGKGIVVADSSNGVTYLTTVALEEETLGTEATLDHPPEPRSFSSLLESPKPKK